MGSLALIVLALVGCEQRCEQACRRSWGEDVAAGECDLAGELREAGVPMQPATAESRVEACTDWCESGVELGWCDDSVEGTGACCCPELYDDWLTCMEEVSCEELVQGLFDFDDQDMTACYLWLYQQVPHQPAGER
jgi:hypothetical protein